MEKIEKPILDEEGRNLPNPELQKEQKMLDAIHEAIEVIKNAEKADESDGMAIISVDDQDYTVSTKEIEGEIPVEINTESLEVGKVFVYKGNLKGQIENFAA